MINKIEIEQLVNRAESAFVDCWELLSSMKKVKYGRGVMNVNQAIEMVKAM